MERERARKQNASIAAARCIGCKRQELSCKQSMPPILDETMLLLLGGFALRWRPCLFRLANWSGLAANYSLQARWVLAISPPFYSHAPSRPLLMSSHKGAPLAPSRGTPQLGETYREGCCGDGDDDDDVRLVRSAVGSRCMQTVGR